MNRRSFISKSTLGLTVLSNALGRSGSGKTELTILHTNDTHSRLDSFPMDGGRLQGLGGVARRKVLIDRIRNEVENVLVLDSGDIFQGTPYYTLFGGEPELKAMNLVGYDVATIGNHEFDNGIEALAKVMPIANFDWVATNLDFSKSPASNMVKPWIVKSVGDFRVGIFGLLCELDGMVAPSSSKGVTQTNPIDASRQAVAALRAEGCNLIVCLSHLGYKTRREGDEIRDDALSTQVEGIDLILGGHSHTFIDELDVRVHKSGAVTRITQQGWAGVRLGRVDVSLGARGLAMRQTCLPIV